MSQMDRHTAENLRERLEDLQEAVKLALKDVELWVAVDDQGGMFDVNHGSLKRVVLSSQRFSSVWIRNRIG